MNVISVNYPLRQHPKYILQLMIINQTNVMQNQHPCARLVTCKSIDLLIKLEAKLTCTYALPHWLDQSEHLQLLDDSGDRVQLEAIEIFGQAKHVPMKEHTGGGGGGGGSMGIFKKVDCKPPWHWSPVF